MFLLCAIKTDLSIRKGETVTSGSINAYQAQFEFSAEWEGLRRIAVFQAGNIERAVDLDESCICTVPWEVLAEPGRYLMAGVCGMRGCELVFPTVWANLGMIQEGVVVGDPLCPPTPELWQQALDKKGDRLAFDSGNLSLMAGDKPLSSVQVVDAAGAEEVNQMLDEVFPRGTI